jgi:hypothetical protein
LRHVGVVQSCLQVRVLRPESYSSRASKCETKLDIRRAIAQGTQNSSRRLEDSREKLVLHNGVNRNRASELFALKWGDISLSAGAMNVARSIVRGFVGPCKTESSQKPVPIHPLVCKRWSSGENGLSIVSRKTGSLPVGIAVERNHIGDRQSCRSICQRLSNWELKNDLAGNIPAYLFNPS